MGVFKVALQIARPTDDPEFVDAGEAIVDTGSEMTWLSADVLRGAGITVRKRRQAFVMANGETLEREVGYAVVRSGDFETVDEIVFARPGDLHLLGARTLEGFNATVDAPGRRLVAAGPIVAALAR